jgi:hypothetical protein
MRITLIDHHGQELDSATVSDGKDAPAEAMILLARFGFLYPGSLLSFDDDKPAQSAGNLLTAGVGHINSLASRLEQRAKVIAVSLPLSADDLRFAARLCRHMIRVG